MLFNVLSMTAERFFSVDRTLESMLRVIMRLIMRTFLLLIFLHKVIVWSPFDYG